jgi:hypothetical protein
MTSHGSDIDTASWYIVLEDWHPVPHRGLDGLPFPLDNDDEIAAHMESAMRPLPIAPGGCMFRGCFDLEVAQQYFETAARLIDDLYLIEVNTLDAFLAACDGFDVGRPNGGFSVVGQEICRTEEAHRRFGHLLNEHGLFSSKKAMFDYLDDRARRVDAEGLEHLDESIPVQVRVIRAKSLRR